MNKIRDYICKLSKINKNTSKWYHIKVINEFDK